MQAENAKAPDMEEQNKDETNDTNIDSMLKHLDAQVQESKKLLGVIQSGIRVVRRQAYVLTKLAAKSQKPKRKRADADPSKARASGFAAASVLSSELKAFMGLNPTDMRSRTEVTKWLCNYIQEHNLQGQEDKRYIIFKSEKGVELQKLLKCDKTQITYFDLQYFLKFHISSKNNPMSNEETAEVTETPSVTVSEVDVGDGTVSVGTANTKAMEVAEASTTPAPARKAAIRPRPVVSTK